ncbi:hypothetical protein [Pseudomonas phage phiH2]|uniref:Uncharacterized protein n=1 Tax=Pseudomonas phage phiH2 TaxID=2981578 RepID=A0A977TNW5_9CAUD|nr:hypothetical protein P9A55_gp74 [Pseudomonas phage phiH2]UXX42089.1 hypothetical protein [Pseudomonas phage phiH2]
MERLTQSELRALARAVSEAEAWRGSMVGNPDPGPLEEFDAFVAKAKQALKKVRRNNNELKQPTGRPV